MSRAHLDYSAAPAAAGQGFDPDVPEAGFYRSRLAKGGVLVGIKIWFGAPLDPVTREELDRAPRWQALANDAPIDIERVWPWCGRDRIDEAEYRHLAGLQSWAEQNAPDSAFADPRRRVDLLSTDNPLPF